MDSELDKKLRDLLLTNVDYAQDFDVEGYAAVDKLVEQIKAAFSEAGYVNSKLAHYQVRRLNDGGFMTGADWYERFEKEVEATNVMGTIEIAVLKMAHRASGLQDAN